ncbi:MAG: DUF3299 domain-containing protein [Pseudomonadota bacterium]
MAAWPAPFRTGLLLSAFLLFAAAFSTPGFASNADAGATVREITWDDLLPEGWSPPSFSIDHFFDAAPIQDVSQEAPVVAAMDGERVKLPGYLVPLSLEGEKLKTFLMVPYFGACIHVPPPPPNQIVYVEMAEAVALEDPYGPHWVTGVMSTAGSETELAQAAYSLAGTHVEIFDWEAMFPQEIPEATPEEVLDEVEVPSSWE